MKLFSLLMGNSTPPEIGASSSPVTDMATPAPTMPQPDICPSSNPPAEIERSAEQPITPASPHYSLNLDRLRRIFQALSSLNQNKATEAEVDDEPLQMRRTYLNIFERFERRFGNKSNVDSDGVIKRRTLQNPKERIMAFINRRSSPSEDQDETGAKTNWAKNNFNRLTSSMRQVKSDSFLSKKMSKRKRRKKDHDDQIRLPSMKTKKRSTVSNSKARINTVSQSAHIDLVKHLQEANSSQHCLDEIDFWNYDYPFENLVFEGGGAKVHTYIGAIKVGH